MTPTLTGAAPNFVVTFVDDNTGTIDNNLELRVAAGTNELEWAVNGGPFSNDLDPAGGTQSATFDDIADIIVQMELGSDALTWDLQTFAFDALIIPDVGNPQQTNLLLEDTGSGDTVDVNLTGTEIIVFNGSGGNDMLTADTGGGDHNLRVDNFNTSLDRITSDVLPEIRFGDLDTLEISQATVGTDVVTFATLNLIGADNYQTDLFAFDTLVIEGSNAVNETYTIEQSGIGVTVTDVVGGVSIEQLTSSLGLLRIESLGGNDRVTVDIDTTSPIIVPILFDGGFGADELTVTGTPTTAIDEVIYTPGPATGAGNLRYENAANARLMSIEFANLAPVVDLVPAAILTVNGTNANNAINYGPGSVATNGLVSVDGFETIEFSNKATLVLNGLAGDDKFNLNNPNVPTALTGITVNAGDPTASDTLVINGRPGEASEIIRLNPTAVGAGTITNAGVPDVDFTGVEQLEVVLQFDESDKFAVDGTLDDDHYRVYSGPEIGRARIEGTMAEGAVGGPFALPSIDVHNQLPSGNTGTINFFNVGGQDTIEIVGSSFNDTFDISQHIVTGGLVDHLVNGVLTNRILFDQIDRATIDGLDGDDVFNLTQAIAFDLDLNGGNPSASDIANLSGASGLVFVSLGDAALASNTTITGYGVGTVTLSEVEVANLDTEGNALSVLGNATDETISYRPTGGQAGTFEKEGLNTQFNFTDVTDLFSIDPLALSDEVVIVGTAGNDQIDVSQSAGSVTVQVNTRKAVNLSAANTQSLVINSGSNDDQLTVNSTTGPVLVPITYDGEGGTNSLRLEGGIAQTDTYWVGPDPSAGKSQITFAGGTQTVHFTNLAPVLDLVIAPVLTVNANNANNAINYTQGPNSGNEGINFALTGLVSVDEFETIEFTNKEELVINGLAGDDKINLNNPAVPNALGTITVNGGDPTASDHLVINDNSPGIDAFGLTPTGTGMGTITHVNPVPVTMFTGIEHLSVVVKQNDFNTFFVDGTAGDDSFRVDSGPEIGRLHVEGTMNIAAGQFSLPSIDIFGQNGVNAAFNPTGGGTDTFEIVGTEGNDAFFVTSGAVDHEVNGSEVNFIQFDNVDALILDGRDGDDQFEVNGSGAGVIPFSLHLLGGNPSHSDIADFSFPTGPVVVSLPDAVIGPDITITGYGAAAAMLSGVEIVNMDTDDEALTFVGTVDNDTFTYTPTGAEAGRVSLDGLNTVFNFTSVAAALTIAGGTGDSADHVIVQGTNARDTIQINQGARTVAVLANNVTALKTLTLGNSIETLTAQGRAGQDTFQVIPAAGIGPFPLDNLLINVDGGNAGENNALVVASSFAGAILPANTFVVVNRSAVANSGTVRVFQNANANPDINYHNVQVVSPQVAGTDLAPNLLILGPDHYEPNELQGNAAFLGSAATIEVEHAAIFPNAAEFPGVPADIDFYRIIAHATGLLDLQIFFRTFAPGLLPGNGALTLEIRDNLGNVVGTVAPNNDGLRAVIPVVGGRSYYARVAGANGSVVNGYSLSANNFAVAAPTEVVLDPADDTGQSNLDHVTFETTDVHFFVHADLAAFADAGITILTPGQAAGGVTPGAAVEVFVNGVSAGFASVVPGTDNTIFEIELNADLVNFPAGGPNAAGPVGYPGFLNLITAAVRIFDVQEDGGGAPDPSTGRGPQSPPTEVLFDNIDPLAPSTPELLPTSDSGTPGDNVTSVNPPAFQGTGEANTIVRIFADGTLIGEGLVGSDATDGVLGNGLGAWEVTVEPMTDGQYVITAQLEDVAGNLGEISEGLVFELDTTAPQRPTIDLLDNYDTGMSNLDNVTYFVTLDFRVSAEPGSDVVIKDGNTVIDAFVMPAAAFTIRTITWPVAAIAAEGPHPLSAEVTDAAGNRSAQSEELLVTIDTIPPDPPSTPELLDASDSGTLGDGITSVNPPAFKGTGEANAKVRIFATLIGVPGAEPELVGEGMVGSDLTDPPEDLPDEPPIGAWEVTIEPLADGQYEITAELEDLAGNISEMSDAFILEIDTLAPQRPTLDLLDNFDTGMSDMDNVTYLTELDFRVSAEPGTEVVIKDGNTVIDMFIMPAVPFTIRTLDFVALEGINGIPAEGPHPLSAEATDDADNRSAQSEELLLTIDSTAPDAPSTPDLLASSDSGTFDNDNVTNIQAVAFDGTGEANAKIRIFANGLLVGQGVVGSDLTDPPAQLPDDPPAFGHWEITTEPLDDGEWLITAEIEDLAGNITVQEVGLTIWVDTVLPNTPYLDLTETSDTGRNNQDNVTRDNTPTVTSTIDDVQGAALNNFPNDIRYRIFDRPGTGPDVLLVDSFVTIPGLSTAKFFTDTLPVLADGVHNLKLEAEDRAGNINDFLLEITIDTVAPPVFFGFSANVNDGLEPDSDSGVEGNPATFTDRITNVTRPTFWGEAEANAIVRLFEQSFGAAFVFGQDVAIPLDGNFAFPNGRWEITTNVDLNDPSFFFPDGLRQMAITAEDLAGNESDLQELDIFIDTQGPQVTNVGIPDHPEFNLFGLKPGNASQGPTPLVFSLAIDLQDLPNRVAEFLYNAIDAGVAETPGLIEVRGDHNGVVAISNITVELDPPQVNQPATATIVLNFAAPLPDDRFTLTIDDDLVDLAGNNLDGENNAIEPNDFPLFPSGDGQPGGDFVARFTVDSRPEIGTYAATTIYIDINGNLFFDPQGTNNDTTNRDLTFNLGIVPSLQGTVTPFNVHDGLFAGNFPGIDHRNGHEENGEVEPANAVLGYGLFADGYDKLAAYGYDPIPGGFRWLIDTNHDGIIDPAAGDHATIQPSNWQINGLPIAGNFDGDLDNGDEIGLFDGTQWFMDTNHDYIIDGSDLIFSTNLRGAPIVGDFNGDGVDDLGTWRNDQFTFAFGSQPGGPGTQPTWSSNVQAVINWGLPGTADKPVAADMDQDGIDDIGLWLPERTGTLPLENGHWEFLISNDFAMEHRGGNQVNALNHPFSPTPLGHDIFAQFGDAFALPIVGNFDPPVAKPSLPEPQALPAMLGTLPMGTQVIDGDQWYSFTPLRAGTVRVEASTSTPGTSISATLYDENYRLRGSSSASADAQVSLYSSITAGETYMLRLSGDNATADVTLSNQVPVNDRLDTSRDGIISPLDALRVINSLILDGVHATPMDASNAGMYLDTTLDGIISPLDALQIINYLITHSPSPTASPATAAGDAVASPSTATADDAVTFAVALDKQDSTGPTATPAAIDSVYAELDPTLASDGAASDLLLSDAPVVEPDDSADEDDDDLVTADVDLDWLS